MSIGLLQESPLHAEIKRLCSGPGDRFEVPLEGYIIDLVRSDGELVEVQTGNFRPLRPKLERLLDHHRMRIVHPLVTRRRLVRLDPQGQIISSRQSPKRQKIWCVLENLVSFPTLLTHPNFALEVWHCHEEQRQQPRQRKTRHLLEVIKRQPITTLQLAEWLPDQDSFSSAQLSQNLECTRSQAQCLIYCARALGLLRQTGKAGRSPLYSQTRQLPQ